MRPHANRPRTALLLLATLVAVSSSQLATAQNPFRSNVKGYPKWSAFTGSKWDGTRNMVRFNDEWYELVEFEGLSLEQLKQTCEENGWDADKRIVEDLVQLVRLSGVETELNASFKLRDSGNNVQEFNDVVMSQKNMAMLKSLVRDKTREKSGLISPFTNSRFSSRRSVFVSIEFVDDQPMVQLEEDAELLKLLKINGATVDEFRRTCRAKRLDFKRRFAEDHSTLLALMGQTLDETASVVVENAAGEMITLENVAFTPEKRQALMESLRTLDSVKLDADLKAFQYGLESQFAYLTTNNVDYQSEIAAIKTKFKDKQKIRARELGDELDRLMMKFIDGHASVRGGNEFQGKCTPFLIVVSGDRYVAIRPDRSSMIDNDFPYVKTIDGVSVNEWIAATAPHVADGSTQLRKDRGLRALRHIDHFRRAKELPVSQTVQVQLHNAAMESKTVELKLQDEKPIFGIWPPLQQPLKLEGNIGYFRIIQMDSDAVSLIKSSMEQFSETDGLIIDVRGNGGGIRGPLLELAGYLQKANSNPRFGNVAKYKLAEAFDDDHLSDARHVYRRSSKQFGERERNAIDAFMKNFKPQWIPPDDLFSEWHYMVFSKSKDDPRPHYDKPVVILMDQRCFSATDIFLGALKGWPNVTLVGQSSSGGSARSQSFSLPHSQIRIRCASMASFQPDGQLYDGNGIQPDVKVTRTPEYYLEGGEDVVLETALSILKEAK